MINDTETYYRSRKLGFPQCLQKRKNKEHCGDSGTEDGRRFQVIGRKGFQEIIRTLGLTLLNRKPWKTICFRLKSL